MSKVLFLLKRREDYNSITHSNVGLSTGLYNSAVFMQKMLEENGVQSKLVVCADNNNIDREVNIYKPTHVIIEALWVTPTKFDILQKLHPSVKWIIRLHSELPFMAGEGIAMDWIAEYSTYKNVVIACNAPRMLYDMREYVKEHFGFRICRVEEEVIYLPNYYPQEFKKKTEFYTGEYVNVGCFGAVRPLKNHLSQALGALQFANRIKKKLRFHVNAGRIEMKGEPMIHNLRSFFEQISDSGHQLINHQWTPRESFTDLCAKMDIGLQVSFSETFNIVGADFVSECVPFIGSKEIPWAPKTFIADPTSTKSIADALELAYKWPRINTWLNRKNLINYTDETLRIWLKYFK